MCVYVHMDHTRCSFLFYLAMYQINFDIYIEFY